ncbi:hypothetical protein PFICI_07787 [Pestalotiopsis fici W106-1]|uniref:Xylanolytic transcriptional activator regulatory domain-containing protein n=1 Tax=Pestalotiopsis fici (strain W106-1 / CGMCC3.15140) TaxID=1229662 RepID=W3X2B1_PESFW|nr:uncharacterized protein PFICI_07787 [Pestalotiopsis fici W106-1]ETS80258.1 hypothetical protein PFICI_07787 [Pestalotiopsis fici W106-1]
MTQDTTLDTTHGHQCENVASTSSERSLHPSVDSPVDQASLPVRPEISSRDQIEGTSVGQQAVSAGNRLQSTNICSSNHGNPREGPSAAPSVDQSPIAARCEAQTYFQKELAHNHRLGAYEREVFQVALDTISRCARGNEEPPAETEESAPDDRDLGHASMYPSDEVVCFLSTVSQTIAGAFYFEITSFISRTSFERMAYSLIDGRSSDFTRAEYLVCVNFYMLTSIGLEETDHSDLIKERMRLLRERYRRNAFRALKSISVLSPPSLSLLQALLCGAMLFLMAGEIAKCAQLSSFACLVCTHLGGRFFADLAASSSKEDSLEIRQCLSHCFIMDKSLAMSLGRRSFLPDMEVNATLLMPVVPEMPSAPVSNIYLELAKVQGEIAREMRLQQGTCTGEAALGVVQALRSRMEIIRSKSIEYRSQSPQCTDPFLQVEWMGVDYTYYSMATAITRLHPAFHDDKYLQELCLEDARRSLHALRDMQRHGLESHRVWNAYCLSITWVVLVCPICPFLALFCHIIETSASRDLLLLEEVTHGLIIFEKFSLAIMNVRNLFHTLVCLCKEHLNGREGVTAAASRI